MTDPYLNSVVIDFNDGDLWLERQPVNLLAIDDYQAIHTVMEGETLQSIAFKYYGDSGRWCDIADINSIYDAFEDLEEGMQLYIP